MSIQVDFLVDEACASRFDHVVVGRWDLALTHMAQSFTRSWDWLNVVVMSNEDHIGLNNKYLGHDYPTDVLTFDMSDSDALAGEVYINEAVLKQNADRFGVEPSNELDRLVVHGALHLMGLNDATDEEKGEMTSQEEMYLKLITD